MRGEVALPSLDFVVIGAGKCGTTTVHRALQEHPEVFLPVGVKETQFFARFGAGPLPEEDPEGCYHFPEAVTHPGAWSSLFASALPGQRLGEVCPSYLSNGRAVANLGRYQKDARLVVLLRNPAERLWSRHLHLVRDGRSPGPFEACLDRDSVWWRRPDLVPEGFYGQHLASVYDRFPAGQVGVWLYDQLRDEPDRLLADIAAHIGVSSRVQAPVGHLNRSGVVQHDWLQALVGRGGVLGWVRSQLPAAVLSWPLAAQARAAVARVRQANLKRANMPEHVRRALLDDVYAADLTRLERLLGRSLDTWRH